MLRLQSAAGNAAVTATLARLASPVAPSTLQRRAAGPVPPPPVAPSGIAARQDPRFVRVAAQIRSAGAAATAHAPASSHAKAAQAAAKAPADDKEAQAKGAKAADMAAAPQGAFDRAGFIAAVTKALADKAPRNLDEADKFAGSGKADSMAGEVLGQARQGKESAAKPLADQSAKAPDTSTAVDKPVTALRPPAPGGVPAVAAGAAISGPAPVEQTDLRHGPAATGQMMDEAGVTQQQLATSNEPEFTAALAAKKDGEEHSATAPGQVRATEQQLLGAARAEAQATGSQVRGAMASQRAQALGRVVGAQQQTHERDESRRAEVSGRVRGIFDATKTDVDKILADLDGAVTQQFTDGERLVRAQFTADHKARFGKYKDERYSGAVGWGRWLKDQFAGLPPEASRLFEQSKAVYERGMQALVGRLADTVGREITRAKARVAQGRLQITQYVQSLPRDLQRVGKQAADDIGGQFEQLDSDINDKSASLTQDIADKYAESRQAVDEEIKAAQEENKGLWDKAKDAIGGAITTILQLKNLLLGVLARAANAIERIIKDPIGFLGNLINAVKAGVMRFAANIGDHLRKGLQGWLFGQLAEAGIEIPDKFDLRGLLTLVLQLLGLTWASIRARIVRFIGEPAMKVLEGSVEVVKVLVTEGVGGLWRYVVQHVTDLYDQVMAQIKDFVITKVITAGITWLISLLNPAAAFIKACKMIYDLVMWLVENAARLKSLVDTVLDSVESIAGGGVGAVAGMIEGALAKAVPMVISGLASLLGLGGVAAKVRSIIEAVQRPVGKVVDKVIGGIVKAGKAVLKRLRGPSSDKDAIDVQVPMRGETHHLRNDGPGGALELHSAPVLVNTIQHPVVQGLVAKYNAAKSKAARNRFAVDIARWIATNMPATGPGGSAPGIGKLERHGSQPPRLEKHGPPLWWLRSEHVVPFSVIRGLWEALGVEGEAERGVLHVEDAALTTILIYKGAADLKDKGESDWRRSAAARIRRMTATYLAENRNADTPAADARFREQIMNVLRAEQKRFVTATWKLVEHEHAMQAAGSTHGALRAESSAIPAMDRINEAADLELNDAERILDKALADLKRPTTAAPAAGSGH